MDILIWTCICILFFLSYVGVLVPLVPDIPFLLGGFLLYQLTLDDGKLSASFWVTVLLVSGLLIFMEYITTAMAVKKVGGTTSSILVAMLGLLIFSITMGPIGFFLGPFLSVFVFELIRRGTLSGALKVSFGTIVGLLSSIFVKLCGITILIAWFFYLIFQ